MTDDWRTCDDPRFELRFRYPDPTPLGQHPVIDTADARGLPRVHARTEDRELYVELVRFPPITAGEEHARHRLELEARFGAGSVSSLSDATLAGQRAHTYSFRWPEGERIAVLLRTETATYRVIYNSASPLNARVVETFELRG